MTGLGSPPIQLLRAGVTFQICFLQKCPKKIYYIECPRCRRRRPGSDADKIARGEMREH